MINITIITSLVYLSNTTVSFHSAWEEKVSSIQIELITILERLLFMACVVGCPYTTGLALCIQPDNNYNDMMCKKS